MPRLRVLLPIVALLAAGGSYGAISAASPPSTPSPPSTTPPPTTTTPLPVPPDPWTSYRTAVDPGSAIQFASGGVGWRLSGELSAPYLDSNLSAGSGFSSVAWPGTAISESTDGGVTWHSVLTDQTGIWGMDLLSPKVGWAVGVTSLLRTTNGAASWVKMEEPQGTHLVTVDFVSPTKGFGLTTSGKLVESKDGGATWTTASLSASGGALCFASPTAGYVADQQGDIFATSDGGSTWSMAKSSLKLAPGYEWDELSCAATNAWLGIRDTSPPAQTAVGYVIEATTDAGAAWSEVAASGPSTVVGSAARIFGELATVGVLPTGTGLLLGLPSAGWGVDGVVSGSSTGGPSFASVSIPAPPAKVLPSTASPLLHILGLSFVHTTGWIYLVNTAITGPGAPGWAWELIKTTNGGRSWSLLETSGRLTPPPPTTTPPAPPNTTPY